MKKKTTAFGIFALVIGIFSSPAMASEPANQEKDLPETSYLIERSGYSIVYDPRTRNPIYAYEKLSSSSLAGRVTREDSKFKEDPRIPEIFRSTLKDYQRSGYDRGHLAPAANHKSSVKAMDETFYMSNMCPQCPQFNRGYWAKLEKHVRDLTQAYQTVEVFTGPLYLPQEETDGKRYVKYQVIGKNDVAVPTHFYKVLLMESPGEKDAFAYILPNETIDSNIPLEQFKTNVQKVEKAAGIIFPKR